MQNRFGKRTGRRSTSLTPAIILTLGLALLAVGLASAGTTTVGASAALTGSGTSYRLAVTNTGTEPILCFGLLLDGVQPTSATGPSGVLTRVGTFQGRGLVHMQGNPVVPPGGTVNVDFQTNVAIAANAGGEIRYSATCLSGSDIVGRATGPPAPPPPKPKPCECKRLRVEAGNYSSAQVNTGPTSLKLTLRWFLSCSAGAGNCIGKLKLAPPAGSDIRFASPRKTTVTCRGKCDTGGATSASGSVGLRVTSVGTLDFDNRRGRTVVFSIRRFCVRNGKDAFVGSTKLSLVFAGSGFLDKKKSDLNGNGKPDGGEKK